MIIGIDGNEANIEKKVGVGKYAYELLWQLYKNQKSSFGKPFGTSSGRGLRMMLSKVEASKLILRQTQDDAEQSRGIKTQNYNFKLKIYLKDKPLPDLPKETDWWQYKMVGPGKLWTQIGLPLALFEESLLKDCRLGVFFTPTHYAPRFCPCPNVVSIMDLSFLYFPRMFKKQDLWQLKNWTAYSIRKASKVLTISESSKRDIIEYYQIPEDQVVVTYPGYDMLKLKSQNSNLKTIREKYGIESEYILSVGTLQPRKNFVRLIEAFKNIKYHLPAGGSNIKKQDENIKLVIVGKKGWLYQEILDAPNKFGIQGEVKFLDYVPDEDLAGLYKGARCFVLVSLYEGFGLPVLEAMSLGCPVVVSNVSSLPEVAGEAGVLVNPNDLQDIAKGIGKVLKMNSEERNMMIQKGLKQAKKFSWEKCAKETLRILEEVADQKS